MKKTKILLLAANPKGTASLRIDEELRKMEEGIKLSKYRDALEIKAKWAVTSDDLRRALLEEKPDILHFTGHGVSGDAAQIAGNRDILLDENESEQVGSLVIESEQGTGTFLNAEALTSLVAMFKDSIRCIVLNACHSQQQAALFSQHIAYTVGMKRAVPDATAIAFAVAFYEAIGNAESIPFAFEFGVNNIKLKNLAGDDIPHLNIHSTIEKHTAFIQIDANEQVDYQKLNKIQTDGNSNLILQDISGSSVTVNYNDVESLKGIFQSISESQMFEIKQIIGGGNKEILSELRKVQDQLDEQNTQKQAEKALGNLDDFFKEIAQMKMESAKKRILTNYKLLREYEELLILEDDPKRKMRYEKEIETIKNNILKNETELQTILKK